MNKITYLLLLLLIFSGNFAFSQSYKKIHNKAIVVDSHNDVPSFVIELNLAFDSDLYGKTYSDIFRLKKGGVDVQIFSIFCDGDQTNPYQLANREIDSVYAWVERNPDKMMLVTNPAELQQAVNEKKIAAMLGVEGGHMIEDDITKIDSLYNRGVRYMTLTWNNSTSWATSAAEETLLSDSFTNKGLTDKGIEIVKKMNALGMMVDVSHVGEQTFQDIIQNTTKPIIASHSCVYSLCPHPRNLKDNQIQQIAKNGGVIQLNFYSIFLDSTYSAKADIFLANHQLELDSMVANNMYAFTAEYYLGKKYHEEFDSIRPPLSLLMDHLDYIVNMVGVDYVGLGSDFDGINTTPLGLDGAEDFPLITKELIARGYSVTDINKILGGNFIRVFEANQ